MRTQFTTFITLVGVALSTGCPIGNGNYVVCGDGGCKSVGSVDMAQAVAVTQYDFSQPTNPDFSTGIAYDLLVTSASDLTVSDPGDGSSSHQHDAASSNPRDMAASNQHDGAVPPQHDAAVNRSPMDMAVATPPGSMAPAVSSLSGMVVEFNEECDGAANSQPDPTKWQFSMSGHDETDPAGGAMMDITLPKLDGNGLCLLPGIFRGGDATKAANYSVGAMITKGESGNGYKVMPSAGNNVYMEWRSKLPPANNGAWPALWAISSTAHPYNELDIMEQGPGIGPTPPFNAYGTYWNGPSSAVRIGGSGKYGGPDLTADFHIYSALWTTTQVTWYFDGAKVGSTITVPTATETEISPIANFQIGGAGGTLNGVGWPRTMEVDYLRVFRDHL